MEDYGAPYQRVQSDVPLSKLPPTAVCFPGHYLPPLLIKSPKERIRCLHVRTLAPIPLRLFLPLFLGSFVLVDYPLPERDDLPAVCVCDFHECDVRVAHVLACMIYSFL